MIVVLMTLLSLSAVYFTRLLHKWRMRAASVSVTALYIYLIVWIYAVFIIDIADLGFAETETRLSLLHGSDIYHSFVKLNGLMAAMPLPLLEAIAAVAAMTLVACFIVVFHGVFEISREIIRFVKKKRYIEFIKTVERIIKPAARRLKARSLRRLYCRANC